MNPNPDSRVVRLEIPFLTLLKVLGFAVAVLLVAKLASLIFLVYFAILLAVTADPIVETLRKRGIARGWSVIGIALLTAAACGGFIFLVFPPLASEVTVLMKELPKLKSQILGTIPRDHVLGPLSRNLLEKPPADDAAGKIIDHAFAVGGLAIGGLSQFVLILVMAIYFLHDGRTTKRWVLDFFSASNRARLEETSTELERVIVAYVAGQFITSLLVVVFVFVLLTILRVPTALVLGILAGVFDVLPVLGFFVSIVPVALMALTVSPQSAIIVVVAYMIYHQFENYVIAPKVYGKRMRLSTLTVLLGLLAGALVAGIPGALAILPMLAAYPVIERIWLRKTLGEETVRRHRDAPTPS